MSATKRKRTNGALLYECDLCGIQRQRVHMIVTKEALPSCGGVYCKDFERCDQRRRKAGRL